MIEELNAEKVIGQLQARKVPHMGQYFAMYSSYFGGIIRDPSLMLVPVDDHIVHRGDGVFEAVKFTEGRVYTLDLHLQRLARSMKALHLQEPKLPAQLKDVVMATVRASGQREGIIRLFVSRGPGGFTTNPYESIGSQLYVVITAIKHPTAAMLKTGVKVALSQVPIKPGWFATVKSCNYLPNVMMKKEALDLSVDFTVALDEQGHIAEGSTENVGCVTDKGDLVIPPFVRTLQGITVTRILALAPQLVSQGLIKSVSNRQLSLDEFKKAKEIHIYGTTADAMPVGEFEGRKLSEFTVCHALRELLHKDLHNPEVSDAI